jgi:phage terminase large subunit
MRTALSKARNRLEAIEKSLVLEAGSSEDFSEYQDNPIAFVEEILKETLTDECKTLMESVRDNPVTIARSGNALGKSFTASRIACWFFKVFPGSQVFCGSAPPESNLRKILWGEISTIVERHPGLFKGNIVKDLYISRSAKSFLCGVSIPVAGTEAQREAKWSGKHAPHLLFLIDEADSVPDEIFRAIESCMSGGIARLLCMLNPRSESGEVYRMMRDGKGNVINLSAFSHPNVVTGEDKIPGCVTRKTTVRRINEWTRPLAPGEPVDSECFLLPDYLEGATAQAHDGSEYPPLEPGHYRIMQPEFSYMCLGRYPAKGSNQLISREWLLQARERFESYIREHGETLPPYVQARAGLDVAEFGVDLNALCFRYSNGFVPKPETWKGMDPYATGHRAHEEIEKRNISGVGVDACGVGAAVPGHLRALGVNAFAVRTFEGPRGRAEIGEFGTLRDEIWWRCREWLKTDPNSMLPNDEKLFEELLVVTYEVKNGKIRVMDKPTMKELLRRSPDRADALTLTFYGSGVFDGCDLT